VATIQYHEWFREGLIKDMIDTISTNHLFAQVANFLVLCLFATNFISAAGFVSQHRQFLGGGIPSTIVVGSVAGGSANNEMKTDGTLDTLHWHISSLTNGMENDKDLIRLVPSTDIPDGDSKATEINSLIFQPKGQINGDLTFAIVILPSSNTVDVAKLSSLLAPINKAYPKWELSPSTSVEKLCGYKPGTVPPLGYFNEPFGVVIDRSLIPSNDKGTLLLGGGGTVDYRCLVQSSFLLECTNAKVADIIKFNGQISQLVSAKDQSNSLIRRPKPFFPISPPAVGTSSNVNNIILQPHRPIPVTALGIITSARQISRRLVFADFAPPDHPVNTLLSSYEKQLQYEKDMPWRSGEDGKDMYVQIIVGKTFCEQAGEDSSDRLKLLKPGRLVLIRGAVNVDPKQKNGWDNSSGNWAQKRSLDVIISSFTILAEPDEVEEVVDEHMKTLNDLPWERKRRYEQRAVASAENRKKNAKNEIESMSQDAKDSVLTLAQFNSQLQGSPLKVNIVDSYESMKSMANDVTRLSSQIENSLESPDLLDYVVGLDCEWRPTNAHPVSDLTRMNDSPVALMQISIPAIGQVYLVDTHKSLRPTLAQSEKMLPIEEVLSQTISILFLSTNILKVGYMVAIDFKRLAGSFPHLPCFRRVNSVVELSTLAKKLHPTILLHEFGSLQRLTKMVLGYDISKEQQCSDWEKRPITPDQIEYGTLDCALPPRLLDEMAEGAGTERMKSVLPHCTTSWRFQTLDSDQRDAIRLLKARRIVSDSFIVIQSWPSGNDVPAAPSVPKEGSGLPYTDLNGIKRLPSHFVKIGSDDKGQRAAWEDMVGEKIGKTKGKCLDLLALHSITEGTRLEYNPRSGFVPFQDGIALFVNMPSSDRPLRVMPYPNEWLDKGQILTWYIRPKDWKNGQSDTANLLGFGESDISSTSITALFVRCGNSDFIFCGVCTASLPPETEDNSMATGEFNKKLVKLYIRLNDWNSTKYSTVMRDLVKSQNSIDSSTPTDKVPADVSGDTYSEAFQERLASMVIDGDVIGALGLALDASKTKAKKDQLTLVLTALRIFLLDQVIPR